MGEEQSQESTGKLEPLARQRFGESLTLSEIKLLRAVVNAPPKSPWAECGPSFKDEDNDPSEAANEWDHEREIRAEVIRWLCVDEKAKHEVDPNGVWIYGGKITGKLDLSFAVVPFPLLLDRCRLMEDAELHDAQLPDLNLQGSWVRAITADRLVVKGDVFFTNGFHAEGEVRLPGAQIGGNLRCDGGTFVNSKDEALFADNINVQGYVFLRHGFRAEGEVVLRGAQVGANLECDEGTFINPGKKALDADTIRVRGNIFLRNRFRAEGEVRLVGAEIGGALDCQGGTFVASKGRPFDADSINVHESVFLSGGFRADGEVNLAVAQIGGDLDCHESIFSELDAYSATVKGNLWWLGLKNPEHTVLDLRNASVGSMGDDDDEKKWPMRLVLDGFVYGRISAGPSDAKSRLRWLARQVPFTSQPYRQLAKVLTEGGDEDGAVTVLEEMERLRRMHEGHSPAARLESWVFRESVGYGYNPARAIWEILGLSALAWIIYRRSYLAGNIVPTDKDSYKTFIDHGQAPPHYPAFAPLVYSLENSLPVVTLGQRDKWRPGPDSGGASASGNNWPTRLASPRIWAHFPWLQRRLIHWGLLRDPNPKAKLPPLQRFLVYWGLQPHPDWEAERSRPSRWFTSRRFVRWFLWIQILLGWLLATLFLAGVTGIVRKD